MAGSVKIENIHHYTISVPNLDASVKWHTEKLGYRLIPEKGRSRGTLKSAYMQAQGFLLEILEVPGAAPVPAYALDCDTDLTVRGHKHYALSVDDAKQAAKELRGLGVVVVAEKEVGPIRAAFVADECGALLELLQQGPSPHSAESKQCCGAGQPIVIRGIHHAAINVPSRDEAVIWYTKKLGLTLTTTMEIPGTDVKVAFLAGPGFKIEVFEAPSAAAVPGSRLDPARDIETLGNKYFGLAVSDVDRTRAELKALGVKIIGEKEGYGERSLFIHDNAGIVIELNGKEMA